LDAHGGTFEACSTSLRTEGRLPFYAIWTERKGKPIADSIEVYCVLCAEAEFIGKHFIVDKAG
jgi:hypothetical protein